MTSIDLYETTDRDRSGALTALTDAVRTLTRATVHQDQHGMGVGVLRADGVTVAISLDYDDQGRYIGLEIGEIHPEFGSGGWSVHCSVDDLARFLRATLMGSSEPQNRSEAIRSNLESYEEWCCTCRGAFDASDSLDCPECGRQQPWKLLDLPNVGRTP